MQTFRQYITEKRNIVDLIEKQIIVGKGKRYGQVVFMAGGAGSGKGFENDVRIASYNIQQKMESILREHQVI